MNVVQSHFEAISLEDLREKVELGKSIDILKTKSGYLLPIENRLTDAEISIHNEIFDELWQEQKVTVIPVCIDDLYLIITRSKDDMDFVINEIINKLRG